MKPAARLESPSTGPMIPHGPDAVAVAHLHERLGWCEPAPTDHLADRTPLHEWRMGDHDSPILRYLYRQTRPRRHLEFGTWEGRGALDCLEVCDATVWSINLREGETNDEGRWAYDAWLDESSIEAGAALATRTAKNGRTVVRTDALGAIGHLVHKAGLGHRLCQIYCDSRQWDSSNYPDGFFDSALIDGGHTVDVVSSDTCNTLRLVRSGGLILWHDYCPDATAQANCSSIAGVMEAVRQMAPTIDRYCADWFWIGPSWLLVGVRNSRAFDSAETRR